MYRSTSTTATRHGRSPWLRIWPNDLIYARRRARRARRAAGRSLRD
ncbi:MAG: hypothetical protein AVDCRST_MAG67-932 [uncultured Solirubrobacteraceae bacterium]|uniref:Uncharacterized protein n=1 Tax=uncultured Solirubrobacteraceae bacterium TaxID=1162706 RepID=A0A6J4RUN6_9ACTN|nr:MAG: hypothetical protein AVDCRST_MAG67-932 [uncultured Solirubrobacteraceae bacterium]